MDLDKQIAKMRRELEPWPMFVSGVKTLAVAIPLAWAVLYVTVHAAAALAMWWPL